MPRHSIWKASLTSLSFVTPPGSLPSVHPAPPTLSQNGTLKVPMLPPQPFGFFPEHLSQPTPPTVAVKKGVALYESLTSEQQQKLQAIYKRYQPQLNALMQQLPPLTTSGSIPAPSTQDEAEMDQQFTRMDQQFAINQRVTVQLEALQKQINREIEAVLTQEQIQLFQASLVPSEADLFKAIQSSESEHF